MVTTARPCATNQTDADLDHVYEVTVQVSDGAGGSDTQAIAVTVTDVDEFDVGPVSDANAAANAVDENAPCLDPICPIDGCCRAVAS